MHDFFPLVSLTTQTRKSDDTYSKGELWLGFAPGTIRNSV